MTTGIKKGSFGANLSATNPIVTQQAMEFFQSMDGFLAVKNVPLIRVPVASGKLAIVKQEYLNRDDVRTRSDDAAEAEKSVIGVGTVDFSTDARALEFLLTAAQAAKLGYEYGMDAPRVVTEGLALKANIHTEGRFAALWASGSWYRTVTGAASDSGSDGTTAMNRVKWSDATKDPIAAIKAEKRIFLKRTGKMPTHLRMGYDLFEQVASHPLVRAQVALTVGGTNTPATYTPMATEQQLSLLCGLNVSYSYGIKNTSDVDGTPDNQLIINGDDALMTFDVDGEFNAVQNNSGEVSVALTKSCGFARVAWTGVAPNGFQVRSLQRQERGAGGSQSWILDLFQGYVIVDNQFGTFFDGMR